MSKFGDFLSGILSAPVTQQLASQTISGFLGNGTQASGQGSATVGGVTISSGGSQSSTKMDWVIYVVGGIIILIILIVSLFGSKKTK